MLKYRISVFAISDWSVSGAGLRRLGKILHLSKSGNLIVQLEQPPVPSIGAQVVDYKLKRLGVVNNILGPVKNSYVSVKPVTDINGDFAGRVVYLVENA